MIDLAMLAPHLVAFPFAVTAACCLLLCIIKTVYVTSRSRTHRGCFATFKQLEGGVPVGATHWVRLCLLRWRFPYP